MATGGRTRTWPGTGTGPGHPTSATAYAATRPAHGVLIEIDPAHHWQPPEPRPWRPRTRIIAGLAAAAALAAVYLAGTAGISRPASLAPVFQQAGAPQTLAVDGTRAYVAGDGTVRAYRLADGALLWSRPIARLTGFQPIQAASGGGGNGNLVVSTVDTGQRPTVQVLDGATGRIVWHRETRLVGVAGDVVVVTDPPQGAHLPLRGIAPDGRPLWTRPIEPWAIVARPATLTSQVELVPGRLRVRDLTTGRAAVDVPLPDAIVPTSASVVGGLALVVDQDGMIDAFDTGDGHLRWRQPSAVTGLFSAFTACGRHICHVNDNGTFALDRATGQVAWKSVKRYTTAPVDDDHMFAAETFEGLDGPGTQVLDPRTGEQRAALAPWRALGAIAGTELLVWRRDGTERQLLGFYDARTGRTRVVGRADGWTDPPRCVLGSTHLLCAGEFDVAAWRL